MVLAVGSRSYSKWASEKLHSNAELYFESTLSWKTKATYPFDEGINKFEILARSDYFIVLGGLYGNDGSFTSTNIVAMFKPVLNKWTKIGDLLYSRHGFGVIDIDTKILVIGGQGDMRTEICVLKNETIECKSREPTLYDFVWYPAMMSVSSEFTKTECQGK